MTSQSPALEQAKRCFGNAAPANPAAISSAFSPRRCATAATAMTFSAPNAPTERSLHIDGNAVQPQPEQPFVLARRYDIGRTVIHLTSRGGKEDQFLPYGHGLRARDRDNRR